MDAQRIQPRLGLRHGSPRPETMANVVRAVRRGEDALGLLARLDAGERARAITTVLAAVRRGDVHARGWLERLGAAERAGDMHARAIVGECVRVVGTRPAMADFIDSARPGPMARTILDTFGRWSTAQRALIAGVVQAGRRGDPRALDLLVCLGEARRAGDRSVTSVMELFDAYVNKHPLVPVRVRWHDGTYRVALAPGHVTMLLAAAHPGRRAGRTPRRARRVRRSVRIARAGPEDGPAPPPEHPRPDRRRAAP